MALEAAAAALGALGRPTGAAVQPTDGVDGVLAADPVPFVPLVTGEPSYPVAHCYVGQARRLGELPPGVARGSASLTSRPAATGAVLYAPNPRDVAPWADASSSVRLDAWGGYAGPVISANQAAFVACIEAVVRLRVHELPRAAIHSPCRLMLCRLPAGVAVYDTAGQPLRQSPSRLPPSAPFHALVQRLREVNPPYKPGEKISTPFFSKMRTSFKNRLAWYHGGSNFPWYHASRFLKKKVLIFEKNGGC